MIKWIEKVLLHRLIEYRRVPYVARERVDKALWRWKKDNPEDFQLMIEWLDYLSCLNEKKTIKLKNTFDIAWNNGKLLMASLIKKRFVELDKNIEEYIKKDSISKPKYY